MFSKKVVDDLFWWLSLCVVVYIGDLVIIDMRPSTISLEMPNILLQILKRAMWFPIGVLAGLLIAEQITNVYRKIQFGLHPEKKVNYLAAQTRFRATKARAEQLDNELYEFARDVSQMTFLSFGVRAGLLRQQAEKQANELLANIRGVQAYYGNLKPTLEEDRKYPSLKWYKAQNAKLSEVVAEQEECEKMREALLAHPAYHEKR